jgi:hypothetical protein
MENNVLKVHIDYKQNIDLFEFTNSIIGLNNLYNIYTKSSNKPDNNKLFIKEIKQGSIIICITETTLNNLLPNIEPSLYLFTLYFINICKFLTEEDSKLADNLRLDIKILNNFKSIFKFISIKGNSFNININFGNKTINHYIKDTDALRGAINSENEIKRIKESGDKTLYEKVRLSFYQARNVQLSESYKGNTAIINEISKAPQLTSFIADRIRYDMLNSGDNPFNITFIVDVNVVLKDETLGLNNGNNIREYEILKLHTVIDNEDLLSDSND